MAMYPGKDPGQGDDQGDYRRFPPEQSHHEIDDDRARLMRKTYLERFGNKPETLIQPGAYARAIFDQILAQPNCVGIRFYPGCDAEGRITIMFCGVDPRGDDILAGVIGDDPFRCPPMCSKPNGVLHF
jgi:hypothetical protein